MKITLGKSTINIHIRKYTIVFFSIKINSTKLSLLIRIIITINHPYSITAFTKIWKNKFYKKLFTTLTELKMREKIHDFTNFIKQ